MKFCPTTYRVGVGERPSALLVMEGRDVPVKPTPCRGKTCGLPAALLVMMSWPVRNPAAVGVNFNWKVHATTPKTGMIFPVHGLIT